jgi:hypothetical protein
VSWSWRVPWDDPEVDWEDGAAPFVDRIREVHADRPVLSARLVHGHGQNNTVLIVNDELIFRFPRYAAGVRRLEAEAALLERIRPRLPLPVPHPRYSSFEPREVGRVFMGYRRIPGEPLWMDALRAIGEGGALSAIGAQLGEFLRCLDSLPLDQVAPGDAGGSVLSGALGRPLRVRPAAAVPPHAGRRPGGGGAPFRDVPGRP